MKHTLKVIIVNSVLILAVSSTPAFGRATKGSLTVLSETNRYEKLPNANPQKRPVTHRIRTSQLSAPSKLLPHRISLLSGRIFDLNLPEGFGIRVAAQGLKRVRFMTKSPDDRIFVTDMYNLTDNKKGAVYILEGFDLESKSFAKVIPYLTGLRNPNSVAFFKDDTGTDWLYLTLTDRLVRYRYSEGDNSPTTMPEVITTFPDYGLNYKYGGWHLTRTIAIGNNGKIYVSVGSSCNACEETESVRASVLEMDLDGTNQRSYVRGLRNAVGLKWIAGSLWATDMGADHLGIAKPADTMYKLKNDANYGWPYCYQSGPKVFADPGFNLGMKKLNCREVPVAHAAFDAHSSPLGFQYFDAANDALLAGHFLVALHGSTRKSLGRGYRVSRVPGIDSMSGTPEDFITGFIKAGRVFGRPADIMSFGKDAFLLTDDNAGVVYYVFKSEKGSNP